MPEKPEVTPPLGSGLAERRASSLPLSAEERIAYFRARSASSNTRRAYAQDLEAFARWGGHLPQMAARTRSAEARGSSERSALSSPAAVEPDAGFGPSGTPPEQVERYLAEFGDQLKISTLRRRVAAINKWNRSAGCFPPGLDERVRTQLAGIARAQARAELGGDVEFRVRRAAPLLRSHLKLLLGRLGPEVRDVRDRALILVGWSLGARRSELMRLRVEDLRFDPDGVDVFLPYSKTDTQGVGAVLGIPRVGSESCAVAALEGWLAAAQLRKGPVFRSIDRWNRVSERALHPESVGRILRKRLSDCGVARVDQFSAHSFRAGLITQAMLDRENDAEVQAHSRHRSRDVFQGYVRRTPRKRDSFLERLLSEL